MSAPVPPRQTPPSNAFKWFFAGRVIDLAGSAMTTTAISLSVLEATGSPTDVGVVLAANVAPSLILLLVGGVVADRWQRGRILVATCSFSFLIQATMAAMFFAGRFHLATMAILATLNGMVAAFNSPALRGIIPELVDRQTLQQANASLATARNATRIIGPAVAGITVATIGGGYALSLDALSILLAAAIFTKLPATTKPKATPALLANLKDGWSAFISLRWVWILSGSYALINLAHVGPWQVLAPTLVTQAHSPSFWGVALSVRAAGELLASALMIRIKLPHPLATGLVLGAFSAAPFFVLAVSRSYPALLGAVVLAAFGVTIASLTYETTLQSHVPHDKLSRVASYDDLLVFATVPLSQALAGPTAKLFGAQPVLFSCAVALVLLHLLPLASKEVRTISAGAN